MKPILFVVSIAAGLALLTRLPIFQIKNVVVVGDAQASTLNQLENLQGQSIFSVRLSQVTANILKVDPHIYGLNCSRGLPSTVRCVIGSRVPKLVWRQADHQFLVDQFGLIYTAYSNEKDLPIIEDRGPKTIKIGDVVASAEIVVDYTTLAQSLHDAGFDISNFFLTDSLFQINALATGSHNPDLPFSNHSPITLKFAQGIPWATQVQAVVAVFKSNKAKISDHIDVRIPGVAYFK